LAPALAAVAVPALTGAGLAGSRSRVGEGCLLLALVAGGSADAETDPAAGEETTAATVAVAVVTVVAAAERSRLAEDDDDVDEAELDSAESDNGAEFDSGVDDDRGDGVEEEAEGTGGGESGRLLTGAVLGGDGMEAGDMVTGAVGGVRCCRCICCCCWMGDSGWWRCVGCRWPWPWPWLP
jgi:hypothetical protein